MKKRDFFLLVLIFLLTVVFTINNPGILKTSRVVHYQHIIDESVPYFIHTLQNGDFSQSEKCYKKLNKVGIPVTLFNLTMDPVVWNDAALNYRGKYVIVKTVDILGNPIGYVGIGKQPVTAKKRDYLNLWIFLIVVFFIISFSSFKPLNVFFLFVLIFVFVFTKEFLPVVMFFSLLYLLYANRYISEFLASLIFFSFSVVGFYNFFQNPFVFHNLITFFRHGDFFRCFIIMILSSAFFLMLKPNKFVFLPVLLTIFWGVPVFAFSLILFALSFISKEMISGVLLKFLLFAAFTVCFGYFYSYYRVADFVKKTDFSYSTLKKRGRIKLNHYLTLARTKGFANLKDFVLRSGLKNEDYYAAYVNVLGEVVEQYSNNIPPEMNIPENFSYSKITVGNRQRFVVAGSGKFKVGRVVIYLACDVYSAAFIKQHSEILNYLLVSDGNSGFSVKLKGVNYFYLISDTAVIFVFGIIFFLAFSFRQIKKGLFGRVIFSIYLGFSVIFILLGLSLFIFSNKIAEKAVKKKLASDLKKVEGIIEGETYDLSDEYLLKLKEMFDLDIGVYGNGVLQFSTGKKSVNLLMPFKVFNRIKEGGDRVYFWGNTAYSSLNMQDIPFAVLSVKSERDMESLYEFLRITVFLFFIIFLVSYFVSYEITNGFVSPLVELSDKAKRVAKGEFDVRVEYTSDDEIRELIDSISFMATSLKRNYDRLKTIIDNVSSAIILINEKGEIVLSNKTFDLMDDKLKKIAVSDKKPRELDFEGKHFEVYEKEVEDNLKLVVIEDLTDVVKASKLEIINDIARKVAHDIKNPLTPIKLNIDYLLTILKKESGKVEEILPKVAENILQKVEELKNISSHFSNMFKASKDVNYEKIDIKFFLENLLSTYPGVKTRIEGESCFVMASKLKLERVFENLIENSISFSPSPEINILIEEKDDFIKIVFRDNGSGIDEKNTDMIFEPYFSTRQDGTGLGLFIVKEFMKEMGGEIKAYPSKKGGHFELKFRKNNA